MSAVQLTLTSRVGWSRLAALLMMAIPLLAAPALAGVTPAADTGTFSVPPELESDVRFWVRVYTEVTTDGGLIHDSWYLGLVYEVLRFEPDESAAQREREVTAAKARVTALLQRFADGDTGNLTRHERRILQAFGPDATRQQFLDAIGRIRFQLGQANRFQEGLIRAQLWESHIARTLQERGVPAEIAALPHVESSFNPAAYSRVGAAGLWQFMPSTAKRYMRVDSVVDERLDPYRATEAAANLMLYNYSLLGTWPLAVTAYNHGPGGLRRAQEDLGTNDIAVIVKRYQGSTFGFASRNFYVSFLAALEVDRNAETFFGSLTKLPDTQSTTVELPDYIPVTALAQAFNTDLVALRVLNPALRPPIWDGERFVPRGYRLRLPGNIPAAEIAAGWARLPATDRYLAQRGAANHRVRRESVVPRAAEEPLLPAATPTTHTDTTDYGVEDGDRIVVRADETLGHFADWSGVSVEALRARNHLKKGATVSLGRRLRLDLSRVGAVRFVAARKAFHDRLQEEFFASHRIAGTETYTTRRGDSLWTLAHQHDDLPSWLIIQYNPDVDFSAVQPGEQLTLPRIEPINRQ